MSYLCGLSPGVAALIGAYEEAIEQRDARIAELEAEVAAVKEAIVRQVQETNDARDEASRLARHAEDFAAEVARLTKEARDNRALFEEQKAHADRILEVLSLALNTDSLDAASIVREHARLKAQLAALEARRKERG